MRRRPPTRSPILKALLFWLVSTLLLAPPVAQAQGKFKVMVTILPLYYLAVNVAGDRADVELLLPSHVDPHDFAATPRDLRRLSQSRLLFVNGLGLEGWMTGLLQNAGLSPDQLVDTSLGVESLKKGATPGRGPKGQDPHIWLDPLRALHQADNIREALSRADPGGRAAYQANYESYAQRLRLLDTEIRDSLKEVKTRLYVTFHDAFIYFSDRYNLNLLGAIEEVAGQDPAPRHLARLSDLVQTHGVRAIFSQVRPVPRVVRSFANDLGLQVHTLDPMETGPLHPEGYERIMQKNLRVIAEALNL